MYIDVHTNKTVKSQMIGQYVCIWAQEYIIWYPTILRFQLISL